MTLIEMCAKEFMDGFSKRESFEQFLKASEETQRFAAGQVFDAMKENLKECFADMVIKLAKEIKENNNDTLEEIN